MLCCDECGNPSVLKTKLILINRCLCTITQCPVFKVVLKQSLAKSATAQEWNFLFGLAQSGEAYLKTYLI